MKIYHDSNSFMEHCFHILETSLPSPEPMMIGDGYVLRYRKEHHCLEVAILQKLARYISGLKASLLLLESGYTQEIGALFRTLDEFGEDIMFLSLPGIGKGKWTSTHEKYLDSFFQEEFDNPNNAILSTQKRPTIPRKKIRGAIAEAGMGGLNQNDAVEVSRTLSQAYSGYVHGASEHILEMVGGNPLRYHLSGMAGTMRQDEFASDYWNYSYRGLISVVMAAKVLGSATLVDECYNFLAYFEERTGESGKGDAEQLMAQAKRKNA
ncbi:hypothetical protein [Vibrio sp. YT-17]|uniref:hypothetical protein n=1 Tax=Vibrio sp. YT-17 TaxID=3074708 RepID=UPI0029644649|nr:hypothetical protein [Vibrio sp. YT-17]MDW1542833.1 hypothetical protein [Vibrio sp. YT-17]